MHMNATTQSRTQPSASEAQVSPSEAGQWLAIAPLELEHGAGDCMHRMDQPRDLVGGAQLGTMKAPVLPLGFGLGRSGLEDARLGNGALSRRRSGARSDVGTSLSGSTVKEACTVRGMGIPGIWLHLGDEAALAAFGIARGSTALCA